ncbi:winged helix-turn-helix transcriptional regulator [Haloarcula litorea]|uniref:winged helix-turn-helix transcriptional regulator n=1 Tax=Haloarcula litorea TaxID=3032579 RepID=UPI0023E841A2|nr:helix-turn-helix domain-containing protein [Halomicroarcula sp. GDY20]
MSHQRARIDRYVTANPGVHFNALVRSLDLAPGQVQYHLKRLRRAEDVREETLYGRTHYYPPEYDAWERGSLAMLRRETARDVLVHLLSEGPSEPSAVAADLDIARSTLEWHLDHLVEQDLVAKDRDAGNRVTLVVCRPAETAELLRLVDPSVTDRVVDRFTRLVDDLLAGERPGGEDGDDR